MISNLNQTEVKELIPHTWPLFFARHGRFTPIQQQAIPPSWLVSIPSSWPPPPLAKLKPSSPPARTGLAQSPIPNL
ncbi:MAG: hypothetical protein M5U34_21170 [Chloroflexi bacterium]|nr:hypothetical protein [Chloroflexota bacterium]